VALRQITRSREVHWHRRARSEAAAIYRIIPKKALPAAEHPEAPDRGPRGLGGVVP
jgi:hypothetical protein